MGKDRFVHPGEDLQAVLAQACPGDVIRLGKGTWHQKLCLRTPGICIIGEGAEETVLLWDDYAEKLDGRGQALNTFRTWTMAVCADGVRMRALSVVNSALHPEEKGQEVALSVYGDDFQMEDCTLRSTQDTLFLGPLPEDLIARYKGFLPDELRQDRPLSQRFINCRIDGSVDFIFGCGRALFEQCELRSVYDVRETGYVAAPAHARAQEEGFTFRACRFTCETGVPAGSVFLARPWRDYGLAVFRDCTYGPHITSVGFDPWNDTHRDRTARFFESPAVPGRVPWANRPEGA